MQQKIFQLKQINSPQYAELGIGCTMLTLLLVPNQCAVVLGENYHFLHFETSPLDYKFSRKVP